MAEEIVTLEGHLIDSLILPKVLDIIMARRGTFEIRDIQVGVRPTDPSSARILIAHDDPKALEAILRAVARHGALPLARQEVRLEPAPRDGVFPAGFHATTNLETSIYLGGRWLAVKESIMDSGIRVSRDGRTARTVKMAAVRKGDQIVVGHQGVRVIPLETRRQPADFEFMTSDVSMEKPKGALICRVSQLMQAERAARRPILWVAGPAVVHSGAGPLLEKLVAAGYVQILFAGNALAAHDVESALMGTSLGVSLREGQVTPGGHENHLHAINTIRQAGGLRQAVRKGILRSGIMHACITHGVAVVLAGSIRDDGPLPDVITDTLRAQQAMREHSRGTRLAIMLATLLHSVATGNLLPAATRVIAVDIQQSAVTKLLDRGSLQSTGIVTDVQPFLRELLLELRIQ